MPHAETQTRPSGRTDPCGDVCYVGFGDMVNYLKNFVAKLLLLPLLTVMGTVLLAAFLLLPQFRLFPDRNKPKTLTFFKRKRGYYGHQKEKDKEFEAFY